MRPINNGASPMKPCQSGAPITLALLDEIENLPAHRDVTHCGTTWQVSPFDIYAQCPVCRTRLKVRSFGGSEIQDLFHAVFAWMATAEGRAAPAEQVTGGIE